MVLVAPVPIVSSTENRPLFDEIVPVDDPKTWHGDRLLANTTNFMRQTFWYIEFCAAVSEGDIGRVSEIIKVKYAVFVSFHSGTNSTHLGSYRFCGSRSGVQVPQTMETSSLN